MSQNTVCCTTLHEASENGHKDCFNAIFHPDINSKDGLGYTPLHYACWFDQAGIIDTLIKNGANVNATNGAGLTPLHTAAVFGHNRCVARLLIYDADPSIADEDGHTPLDLAKLRVHQECIDILEIFTQCNESHKSQKRKRPTNNGKKSKKQK